MAHLLRLIVCGLLWVAGIASASVPLLPAKYQWGWVNYPNGVAQGYDDSPQVACDGEWPFFKAAFGARLTGSGFTATVTAGTAGAAPPTPVAYSCFGTLDGSYASRYNLLRKTVDSGCPTNSSLSGGACVCNTGFVEGVGVGSGTCVAVPTACQLLFGKPAGDFTHDSGATTDGSKPLYGDFTACDSGRPAAERLCTISVSNPTCSLTGGDGSVANGWYRCTGSGTFTGTAASTPAGCVTAKPFGKANDPAITPPAPNPPSTPESPKPDPSVAPPAPCGPGEAPGTVSGTSICAPTGPDTPTAGTSNSSIKNPDGSSSSTSNSTSCKDKNNCTTDTTTCTQAAGASTQTCSTSSSTGSLAGTCSKDAGNTVCSGSGGGTGKGGGFGGDCVAGFKSTGDDAVINAMALEQYKRNCQLFEKDTEERTAYEADKLKGKAGTDQTGNLAGNKSVDVGAMNLQGSSVISGSSCIADKTIVVVGRSITIPFSRLCEFLGYLGTLLVAVAYLVAARIVVGR